MHTLEIIFWISLFLIFYTYMGYGVLLWVIVKLKERFGKKHPSPALPTDKDLPELTLFIAAYNEEGIVDEKMANCLALDYPPEKLHILWVTDGSTDNTNQRLAQWPRAHVLFQPLRMGKTAALNRGMREVKTPYVVFTDANTLLSRESLKNIVQAFNNPKVGCVAGEKRISTEDKADAAGGGEGLYWRYESALKDLDARLYSATGAAGELFAIRTELYEAMKADTLLDDFILSLRIVMRGYTIAYRRDAYAMESGSANIGEEQKRKVRIAAGGLQSIARLLSLLNPFKYGVFTFQYVSHRVLRWTVTPILLFALLPLNTVLLFSPERPLLYAILWLLQALFYLAGSWGNYLAGRHIKNKILFVPYYFLFMNANVLRGFIYLYRRKGVQNGVWEKAKRTDGRPPSA